MAAMAAAGLASSAMSGLFSIGSQALANKGQLDAIGAAYGNDLDMLSRKTEAFKQSGLPAYMAFGSQGSQSQNAFRYAQGRSGYSQPTIVLGDPSSYGNTKDSNRMGTNFGSYNGANAYKHINSAYGPFQPGPSSPNKQYGPITGYNRIPTPAQTPKTNIGNWRSHSKV
uniref:VP2 n=1 Tax=Wenling rattails calicivirus 1 TaxID=2116388 RepID=A0A2P1GMK1_9CALI|nr:VP2 [Wenling rattails calicivirus 1]